MAMGDGTGHRVKIARRRKNRHSCPKGACSEAISDREVGASDLCRSVSSFKFHASWAAWSLCTEHTLFRGRAVVALPLESRLTTRSAHSVDSAGVQTTTPNSFQKEVRVVDS